MDLKDMLNILNYHEMFIIWKRFIVGWSQRDVADELNVSVVKVSRIEKKALKKIKNFNREKETKKKEV